MRPLVLVACSLLLSGCPTQPLPEASPSSDRGAEEPEAEEPSGSDGHADRLDEVESAAHPELTERALHIAAPRAAPPSSCFQ